MKMNRNGAANNSKPLRLQEAPCGRRLAGTSTLHKIDKENAQCMIESDLTQPLTRPTKKKGSSCIIKTDYHSMGSTPNTSDDEGLAGNHCHTTNVDRSVDKRARRKLMIASVLCLLFMTGEAVGGTLASSLAVVTDAAHLLSDFASFMISLLAIYLATRPATKKMSFGWYRAEVMGALVSVLLIWVVTGILVYMAVMRIVENEYEIEGDIMLITASIGVVFNIIMGATLHQHGHTHGPAPTPNPSDIESDTDSQSGTDTDKDSHGHSHGHKQNINVRAAFIHVIGDFVQSIGVLVAAIIIYFRPDWKIADPICTFLFSVLVLFTTINILRDTLLVLMEGTPRGLNFTEVKSAFFEIKGVKEVHNLRMWSLTMNKTALSVHIAIDKDVEAQEVLKQASRLIRKRFGVHDITLQIEEYCETMADCTECKDPKD
ncbi:proton-coupled zinc antiporter SLC30A2-like isoform X2 [Tubulanus polymorphus]|uniref:proton-coupled zinc antiporter SLC30A2-like isoform X2 n=1 Tax=Tubulanus polymorphus TaxID=672921 RepID=UPI003DA39276